MLMAGKCVAIFGKADVSSADLTYKEAFECSKHLSENGYSIVTGGYEGVMEAASKAAFKSGGKAIGIPCSLFKKRNPNPYLSEVIFAENLYERQRLLVEKADAFVAFEPKTGTLSEVSLIFALRKNGDKASSPLCLVGEKWLKIMDFFEKERIIPKNLLKYTFLCENGFSASQTIIKFFSEEEDFSDKKRER
ncbi:MAG: LOG family protein [Acidobacteriota bacterium]